MIKKIILCADDYSYSPGISEAIITLIQRKRLNATSCMVNTKYWLQEASALKPFINQIDIGLHFTLTDVFPISMPKHQLLNIIKKAYCRQLNQKAIEIELTLQIKKFYSGLGKLPDFIDGHQHIHQLPIIRDALIAIYNTYFPKPKCYIRVPIMSPATLKSYIIQLMGSTALKNTLKHNSIPYNTSFSGIYSFSKAKWYPYYFRHFLSFIQPYGLIMCHPGLKKKENRDSIISAREHEFHYLNSKIFLHDCQVHQISLIDKQSKN